MITLLMMTASFLLPDFQWKERKLFFFNFRICELWCGGSDGCISVYTMQENIVSGHEVLNHFEPLQPNVNVLKLVSSHSPVMHSGQTSVWSYVYPGE